MGIPIGKLALYVAGSGLHPAKCLPVSLDVGTNNQALLDDPLYIGYRAPRLDGAEYDDFIEAFVQGVRDVYPRAVIQWEDFAKHHAFGLLSRYRQRVACFNDDIQGTAAVALAGIFASERITRTPIDEQRILFMGAGEACTGIARLSASAMRAAGATEQQVHGSMAAFDSQGLLHEGRDIREPFKREFALDREAMQKLGLDPASSPSAVEVIRALRPTVLVGATAHAGTFTREMVEEMTRHVERPLVMPLSNPTSKAECTPADAIAWSDGRAIVATGSPFDDVEHAERRHVIGQSNNVFIFPGVGLGAVVSEARQITDEMFSVAARTLADCVDASRLEQGALYPPQSELREVSFRIACAVVRCARDANLGRRIPDDEIEPTVRAAVWFPDYVPITVYEG
jgi:malic enzyme